MRNADCGMEEFDIEQGTVSTSHSAFRIPHSALSLLDHRDLEPVRIGHGERPVAPRSLGRLAVERPAVRLDPCRHGNDVLGRRHPQAEPFALLAIPSFREVILAEHDVAAPGLHLNAADVAALFPALADDKAEHIPIPADALVEIVHREGGGHGAEPQRLGLLPVGTGRRAFLGGTPGLLFLCGHRRCSSLSQAVRAPSVASPRRFRQISDSHLTLSGVRTMPTSQATAVWEGKLKDGKGNFKAGSSSFSGPYTFATRFEGKKGTNPEELIAAAHAACFSMALSAGLEKAGKPVARVDTTAACPLDMGAGAARSPALELKVRGTVPGLDQAGFQRAADEAKRNCPVSRALAGIPQITLDAKLG